MSDNQSGLHSGEKLATVAALIREASEYLSGLRTDEATAERQAMTWLKQLRHIPVTALRGCFEGWQATGPRSKLRALDLVEAYNQLRTETRVDEAPRRFVNGQPLYQCPHCQDIHWQAVWQLAPSGGWNRAMRACACAQTPFASRSAFALERSNRERDGFVLSVCGRWIERKDENRWARLEDLRRHGAPNAGWLKLIVAMEEKRAAA